MIPVKVQCDCGQRYAFDVEPVNGRMGSTVACPVCGADGTSAANTIIAQALGIHAASLPAVAPAILIAPPPGASVASPHLPPGTVRLEMHAAPAAPTSGLRLNVPPPPIPSAPPAAQPVRSSQTTARPVAQRPVQRQTSRSKDGWATEETGINKLGTYIVLGPGALASLVSAGFLGIEIPTMILCIAVGACGVIGGVLNLLGRGPIVAGAFIGLIMGLGGYATAYWWIKGRQEVYTIEATIAYVVGCIPGFVLQAIIQQILKKRALSAG